MWRNVMNVTLVLGAWVTFGVDWPVFTLIRALIESRGVVWMSSRWAGIVQRYRICVLNVGLLCGVFCAVFGLFRWRL